MTQTLQIAQTFFTSEVSTLAGLAAIDWQQYLAGTVAQLMTQADAIEAEEGEDPFLMFDSLEIEVLEQTGDTARLRITVPDEEPEEVTLALIEDRWVPVEMAEEWDAKVMEARTGLEEITPEKMQEMKGQAMFGFAMAEGLVQQLSTIETSEEFDATMGPMIDGLMRNIGNFIPRDATRPRTRNRNSGNSVANVRRGHPTGRRPPRATRREARPATQATTASPTTAAASSGENANRLSGLNGKSGTCEAANRSATAAPITATARPAEPANAPTTAASVTSSVRMSDLRAPTARKTPISWRLMITISEKTCMMCAADTAINTPAASPRTAVTTAVPNAARRAPRSSTSRPLASTASTTRGAADWDATPSTAEWNRLPASSETRSRLIRWTSASGKVTPSGIARSDTPTSRANRRIGGRDDGRKVEAPKVISKVNPFSASGLSFGRL